MKLSINGKGGELCIGKLSEEQEDYVFSNAEDEEIEFNDFWEDNKIMKGAWYDFDNILHSNSVNLDDNLSIKNENGDEIVAKGKFEIDLNDDDRFEMLNNNTRVIVGWNKVSSSFNKVLFEKGFYTFKVNDFSKETLNHFNNEGRGGTPCLIGTESIEYGTFWEFDVPNNFNAEKLILISAKFHVQDNESIDFISSVIYDGKIIEKDCQGDTNIKEIKHFVVECNYYPEEKDEDRVYFDYALEFSK